MRISGFLVVVLALSAVAFAGNDVMGEIEFHGKSKVEKTSGVWVDGRYVGYLNELKGSKKVMLLPGEHVISVRQDGYQEFTQRLDVRPGAKYMVDVVMAKAAVQYPTVTSEVKLQVNPQRAAVFLDGQFVGHVGEFSGIGRGLLVAPGAHKIRIALPGYQTFETEINPLPKQKVEVKTELVKASGSGSDPMLNGDSRGYSAPAAEAAPATPPPATTTPTPATTQVPATQPQSVPASSPPVQTQSAPTTPATSAPAQTQPNPYSQPQNNSPRLTETPQAPPPPDRTVWPTPPNSPN